MPKGDFTARALHANNLDLATGPKAPKISQSLSKLEVSQCPSSMQKSIDTPWGHKRAFPVFLLLLSPPLSLFHFSTMSLSGTLQCALLSSRAIYSQVISSVSPPPTWPLRAKQQGHYSQATLPPPMHLTPVHPPQVQRILFPHLLKTLWRSIKVVFFQTVNRLKDEKWGTVQIQGDSRRCCLSACVLLHWTCTMRKRSCD